MQRDLTDKVKAGNSGRQCNGVNGQTAKRSRNNHRLVSSKLRRNKNTTCKTKKVNININTNEE